MAKIDTSTIPNFESLSDADKLKAIQELDIPDPFDESKYVLKEVFDKKASEAANYSRQLKEKMTEDERTKAEAEAAQKELSEKYEALLRKSQVDEMTTKYLALGMDEKLARDTAKAHFENNTDKVFENMEKLNQIRDAKLKEELMRGNGQPAGGSGGTPNTNSAEDFARSLGAKRSGEKPIGEKLNQFYK